MSVSNGFDFRLEHHRSVGVHLSSLHRVIAAPVAAAALGPIPLAASSSWSVRSALVSAIVTTLLLLITLIPLVTIVTFLPTLARILVAGFRIISGLLLGFERLQVEVSRTSLLVHPGLLFVRAIG